MHILFVDDTFETRDLFRLCFSIEGHTVDTAHNGLEAIRVIQQHANTLDVIVMDHHMPQMTGLDVVRHLRQDASIPNIPVILFTGDMPGFLEKDALAVGVAKVVYKPIVPTQLISIVQEVVGK